MKVSELIIVLQALDQDLTITNIRGGLPHPVKAVEVVHATRQDNHFWISYYPEVEDEPTIQIAVLR